MNYEAPQAQSGMHDYDPDAHFDSSSSSGGDGGTSSPSDGSSPAYSAASQQEWALDLGLTMPWTAASPAALGGMAAVDPGFVASQATAASGGAFKLTARHGQSGNGAGSDGLALTGDFWSAAPGQEALSPSGSVGDHQQDRGGGQRATDYFGAQANDGKNEMQMEFDDMVHEDVCGPSTLTSPTHALPTPLSSQSVYAHASLPPHTASAPVPSVPNAFLQQQQPLQQQRPLSIPVDLLAVNAGIAPALTNTGAPATSGIATASPLPSPSSEMAPSPYGRSTRASSARGSIASTSAAYDGISEMYGRSARTSRDPSLSRRSDGSTSSAAPQPNGLVGAAAPATKAKQARVPTQSVNFVAREAVLAANHIPTVAAPPVSSILPSPSNFSTTPPELLVMGVPAVGAKSRVETQIKISLALVRPRGGIKREDVDYSAGASLADEMVSPDGGLAAKAGDELERIGSWNHIRLPRYLALKSSRGNKAGVSGQPKKNARPLPDPTPETTLDLDVAVVSATEPHREVYICDNCQAREIKRSQRKKDSKGKTYTAPAPVANEEPQFTPEEERRKVVVFNVTEFVDFTSGEVVLPTRITCYCRHHKEKKGFCVTYALRDHLGNIVASGSTPPIMITDDHKTNSNKQSAAATAAAQALVAAVGQDPDAIGVNGKRKAGKAGAASKREKKAASPPTASGTSSRPRRAATGRPRRGQTDSDDEADAEPPYHAASKKARPYDAEARPSRKRTSNQHRSPTFAMTPLQSASKPGSPMTSTTQLVSEPVQQHQQQQLAQLNGVALPPLNGAPSSSFGSALGLGGMGDSVMADPSAPPSGVVTPSSTYLPNGRSASMGPSFSNGHEWRSTVSSPPHSPGSTAPSDTFQSFASAFPSPNASVVEPAPAPAPIQPTLPSPNSIPSFAIPATEPIPASFTPSWALQQQPNQLQPPAPAPRIGRLIPGEGPVHGGIEITVLGEHFVRDLVCVFGDTPAATHYWSNNTLVCVLPPSANPGPVVVGIKGVPLTVGGAGLQLFTYKDDSDRSLLELALQVVGLKMTGRLEDASAVAMRIVGNGPGGQGAGPNGSASPSDGVAAPTDTASLAATLGAAARSVYPTTATSRASSRRSSVSDSPNASTTSITSRPPVAIGETRNFEGIVIKFLSLLDLDPSLIPGAAPSLPSTRPPISHANTEQHTLLHLATLLGFHRLVSFLLQRGIAVDMPDRNGYTALHFAGLYGRVTIARLLLEGGASINARVNDGRTALDIARDRDDIDVEELLLARGATPSPTQVTPTMSSAGGQQLVTLSPASSVRPLPSTSTAAFGRRSSLARSFAEDFTSDEDEDDDEPWSVESDEFPSDWTVSDEEGDSADEASEEEIDLRTWSRSRNASTVSLQYLLEAEAETRAERRTPRSRQVSLPDEDDIPAGQPILAQPKPVKLTSSASWLSQKLKPSVPESLNKLQPIAGGVTGVWERAKANRFGVPQMHMPELTTAFPAMPAALTRHISGGSITKRRRAATVGESQLAAGDETKSELSAGPGRDWRAAFYASQWWHAKTPSSPPPRYTPSDILSALPANEKTPHSTSTTVTRSPPKAVPMRSPMRRRFSATSSASEETDAETDAGSVMGEVSRTADWMLWVFWMPVLIFVAWYGWRHWSEYAAPVISTFANTCLPTSVARLLN
ncbi:membrane-bound transcriptional activator [Rhodotorula toruloides]|uniref:Membrane-bound transcriptional activator n=1 Tax=Rhodotorula toruloides TaxID=5286 RepID=A0A511KLB3_RHOTO|nr:membrane-bound transcriptional activator [Rhodotorula toruloides]